MNCFVFPGADVLLQTMDRQIGKISSTAMCSVEIEGHKVTSKSHINALKAGLSRIDLLILTPDLGYPTITVIDDISSWNVGKLF